MLISQMHRQMTPASTLARPTLPSSLTTGIRSKTLAMPQTLRESTKASALPEISPEMLSQTAAVGHAVRMLAFAGFSMMAVDKSTDYIAKQTGNEAINTIATSVAAIAIGAFIRNELTDMQAAFRQPEDTQTTPAQTSDIATPTSLPMTDFPEKALLH